MARKRLLIVDNHEDFPLTLAQALKSDYDVQYCLDGKEALSLLQSFQPDILLTEIVVPNLDGISLLEAAAALDIHPMIMTFTLFYNEYMIHALTRLNVRYWMIKPCDLRAVAARIHDMCVMSEEIPYEEKSLQDQVSDLLFSLSFSKKHQGFLYLSEAILLDFCTPGLSVTKDIYPAIAKKFTCSQATVEHAIRTAIQSAWEKRNDDLWRQYFPPNSSGIIPRPTNSTVITRLAQALHQKF